MRPIIPFVLLAAATLAYAEDRNIGVQIIMKGKVPGYPLSATNPAFETVVPDDGNRGYRIWFEGKSLCWSTPEATHTCTAGTPEPTKK